MPENQTNELPVLDRKTREERIKALLQIEEWRAVPRSGFAARFWDIIDSEGLCVASEGVFDSSNEMNMTHGQLLAATPKLFQACHAMWIELLYLQDQYKSHFRKNDSVSTAMEKGKAAIAEAIGGTW